VNYVYIVFWNDKDGVRSMDVFAAESAACEYSRHIKDSWIVAFAVRNDNYTRLRFGGAA
jgi:hypothetical protein